MTVEITDEEAVYRDLPADPEEAFLQLEKHFRAICDAQVAQAREEEFIDHHFTTYISKVLAALTELGLETKLAGGAVPKISDVTYHTYREFTKDVEHYKTQLGIRSARRRRNFSVRLDTAAKQKIRHYLEKIRQIVDGAEIEASRKQELLFKINAFQEELDRERTRYESYGDLVVEVAGVVDETVGKLDKMSNIKGLIDSIGKVLWGAKKEDTPRLSPPPKKLEGPTDDIPF